MRVTLRLVFGMIVVLAVEGGHAATSSQVPAFPVGVQSAAIIEEVVAIRDFQRRVDGYVTLHRILESPLPPLRPTADMAEVRLRMRTLAIRIQMARGHAKQGDIITPSAGRVFKRRIATCLSREAWASVLAELDETPEGKPVPSVTPGVNTGWPQGVQYGFMPPQLLSALPRLPPELQYWIIGRSLVLWDHHADLIVDVLDDAFVAVTEPT